MATKRPWMQFWVGEYLSETQHLTATQHGAFLLLRLAYWTGGGLPHDESALARIARLSKEEWLENRSTLAALFEAGWRLPDLDAGIAKATLTSKNISAARSKSEEPKNVIPLGSSRDPRRKL